MNQVPLTDILNKPRKPRNNSPYLSSCSSSKRQSVVISQNSQYDQSKPKPDEKTIQQLYTLFKKQGFDNVNGLLKFLELYRNEQPQRKSQSPLLKSENLDRNKFSAMIDNAKQGLNQLENKINTFSNKSENKNKILQYKHLLTEDNENHEYLYENKQIAYQKLYQQAQMENQQLSKRMDYLVLENQKRDQQISQLIDEVHQIKQQLKEQQLKEQQIREQSSSPRPSVSASDYTFTLNVCNSDMRQDPVSYKEFLHTQSQQIKRI